MVRVHANGLRSPAIAFGRVSVRRRLPRRRRGSDAGGRSEALTGRHRPPARGPRGIRECGRRRRRASDRGLPDERRDDVAELREIARRRDERVGQIGIRRRGRAGRLLPVRRGRLHDRPAATPQSDPLYAGRARARRRASRSDGDGALGGTFGAVPAGESPVHDVWLLRDGRTAPVLEATGRDRGDLGHSRAVGGPRRLRGALDRGSGVRREGARVPPGGGGRRHGLGIDSLDARTR